MRIPVVLLFAFAACNGKSPVPTKDQISSINLKRGDVIYCGATDQKFGSVVFDNTCSVAIKEDFNLGMKLLHSFEYDEAEKVFAGIIDKQPDCAMAYWGVAMANFHPLWTPPLEAELTKGAKSLQIGRSLSSASAREAEYLHALAAFYDDWSMVDHATRCLRFEHAMKVLHDKYPDDKEAAVLYALALDAAAKPTDKSFANQKKAGALLNALYAGNPDHPGVVHYIIHTYDYPALAKLGLNAARRYASVAPASAHALHMPSHIFTRLGLWDEAIASNRQSVTAAQCYAASAGIKGHWDEEMHGLDYLMYAYLQRGDLDSARSTLSYVRNIREVHPVNFKVAYAFAAVPARYVLETKDWKAAARMQLYPEWIDWTKYPWQEAIFHFAKGMGCAQTGALDSARAQLAHLRRLQALLGQLKDTYKASQVAVQVTALESWLQWKSGSLEDALRLAHMAADAEDATEKHPVTPGEVIPARELLADMLVAMKQPQLAAAEYRKVLERAPGRRNASVALRSIGSPAKYGENTVSVKRGLKEIY